MDTGCKLRLEIHNILYDVHKYGSTFDNAFSKISNKNISSRDIAFINSVCLNTMRYVFHSKKILSKYVKKKPKIHEEILLCSAITQIVFLNFKEYAVINSSVEIAKNLKLFHGFINACLRKICINKENELKKTSVSLTDLPLWFRDKTKDLSKPEIKLFLKNFYKEPNLHLVFKNKKYVSIFKEKLSLTSETSGFLVEKQKVENISSFKDGIWWVQDFSSSFPLNNIEDHIIDKSCLDMCAAPGGKSFQILSRKKNIVLNDKNHKRIAVLKKNLARLNFNPKITCIDVHKLDKKPIYDFIIVDAPCSAIGTIRKNPEIFYREKAPNFLNLIKIQRKMLKVASQLLKDNGIILYMVCSFLKDESTNQVDHFLSNNNNFSVTDFSLNNDHSKNLFFIKNKKLLIIPSQINEYNIDGYFAIYLKKEAR